MTTNYQRGRAFEYRTRDKALKLGAAYVMRAASSKGAADLIVLWPRVTHELVYGDRLKVKVVRNTGDVWVVQCKRDGRFPAREEIELKAVAEETGAIPVLAKTGKNGRGVEFIDLQTKETLVG